MQTVKTNIFTQTINILQKQKPASINIGNYQVNKI